MLENIKAVVLSVVVFLVFMFGVMMIFINASEPKDLDSNYFHAQNDYFKQCAQDNQELNSLAVNIQSNDFIYLDDSLIEDAYELYDFTTGCNVGYVESSDEQVLLYAQDVLVYAQAHVNDESVLLLDTVYATSSAYSAYLGMPKEYLFFTMNEDKTMMMSYVAAPQVDGSVVVSPVWMIDESSNLDVLKSYTKKLLLKYNEKVKM